MDITPEPQTIVTQKLVYTHPSDTALTATVTEVSVTFERSDIEGVWSATIPLAMLTEITDLIDAITIS